MANLSFDGKRLLFPGGGILDYKFTPTSVQLFTFVTDGTTLNNLQVGGTSLDASDDPLWNFGDTTTDDTINSNFSHTYTGGYVSPAEKTVVFTLLNPNDATLLNLYGSNPSSKNNITSVDISDFTSLETFNIASTDITSIDVTNNTNLQTLNLGNTDITSIDVSNNPNITTLSVNNTNLSSLDITNNPNITSLQAQNTSISSIDLSNNTNLTTLFIYSSSLSSLDTSNNTLLSNLYIYFTNISSLDLTNNTSISQIIANNTNMSTVLFDTGSTYPSFSSININGCSMTSVEVNDFIDHMWELRDNFTSSFKTIDIAGNNADLSFESTHKVLYLQKDYNFSEFGSDYNIPNDIMRFGWTSPGPTSNNITSYFQLNSSNSPSKGTIYGNNITSASGDTDLSFEVYIDTNLSDFQSSSVQWTLRLKYRKNFSNSFITVDNTTYTLTGNTSGFELVKTISPITITNILGSESFQIEYEITLTDNRADKTQDTGDAMTLRVIPLIENSNINDGIVIYPYGTITQNYVRTKWGA